MITASVVALAIQAVQPAPAPVTHAIDEQNRLLFEKAADALRDGLPQTAMETAQTAIDAYAPSLASEKRRIYCGLSLPQTIAYLAEATRQKTDAVALGPGYCTALFLKGYALVDLGRLDDARAIYDRLLVLAPMNAQYLSERGQLARLTKDWPVMLDYCRRAEAAAPLAPTGEEVRQKGLALRCQGFALVEQKQWDEAVTAYNAALKADPNDEKAKGELRYIADHRKAAS